MGIGLTTSVALVLTLLLPLYPNGPEPLVLAFLALVGAAGMLALTHRVARRELLVLSPWLVVLTLAAILGVVRGAEPQQVAEDALPYILFALGLFAGRVSRAPRRVLVLIAIVCFTDGLISLIKVAPHYTPSFRSSYTYHRIVVGLPVLGMFTLAFVRALNRESGLSRRLASSPVALGLYATMFLAMVASVSRGMMLGWVAGMAVAGYLRRPSRVLLATAALALVFTVYSSAVLDVGVVHLRMGQTDTVDTRLRETGAALTMLAEHPLFGAGLGAALDVLHSGQSYLHNIIAYHLWKFGLVGSALLSISLFAVGRQLQRYPRRVYAPAVGGAVAIFAYLVTCAVYKTYYSVWIYGVTLGAALTALRQWHVAVRPTRARGAQ